jgi:hypothetical protein
MSRNKKPAIDINLIPKADRAVFDTLSEEGQAEYFGFGKGTRRNFDVPVYISAKEEKVVSKGNSFIVFGLDRPHHILSGYGGSKDTHCSAIDIVAGRLGYRAVSRDSKGRTINVDPNFKLDAARVYISQKANVDYYFDIAQGNVGNTTGNSPRSTVAIKADTLRFIARENIKLVTRTDKKNSQGGKLTKADTGIYGIDLIAMNDGDSLQPMVRGRNLLFCLQSMIAAIQDLRSIFNNFLQYDRQIKQALMTHTHRSPFYGQLSSPDFETLAPKLSENLVNMLTNVESEILKSQELFRGIQNNYLEVPAGSEATENDKGLFILSKYNSNN